MLQRIPNNIDPKPNNTSNQVPAMYKDMLPKAIGQFH